MKNERYKLEGFKVSYNKRLLKTEEDKERGRVILEVTEYTSDPSTMTRRMAIKKITDLETGEVLYDRDRDDRVPVTKQCPNLFIGEWLDRVEKYGIEQTRITV